MTERKVEFQVVLLAGGAGNRMYPLTYGHPKCLVPVANRPLLSYALDILEQSGFNEVLVVTEASIEQNIKDFMAREFKGRIKIDLVVLEQPMGTADVLRQEKVRSRLQTDFFVMSADTVTNVFLHYLADVHRSKDPAVTVLLHRANPQDPNEKKKKDDDFTDSHYIGLDDKTQRLLMFRSKADIEDKFIVKKSVLRRHDNIVIHNNLLDAHLYLFSHWVLDLIKDKPRISSIQAELMPYLVKNQFNSKLSAYVRGPRDGKAVADEGMAEDMNHSKPMFRSEESYRCFSIIAAPTNYCARANTVQSYVDMNKELGSAVFQYTPWQSAQEENHVKEASKNNPDAQIGGQCTVGADVVVAAASSVKKSVIGNRVKIGSKVKLSNCIVWEDVIIEDGCTLTNTILCKGAHLGPGLTLLNCNVGLGYKLEATDKGPAQFKNEEFAEAASM